VRWAAAAGVPDDTAERPRPAPPLAAAHLTVLWAFAVVQPLFVELSANAEFFVARGNTSRDIIVFALALTLGPPLVLTAVTLVAGLFSAPLASGLYASFVGILGATAAVGVLKKIVPNESAVVLPAAAAAGVAIVIGYRRAATARRFLTVLTPAPAVFLVIFLLFSPVSELVLRQEAAAVGATVRSDTPVVLIVFDELPTISLMDAREQIDAGSYPNFGRLAATSTWYRNATTVADGTFVAVPAILAGQSPAPRLPTSRQYPRSVFTLLAGSYDVHALEPITHVCPSQICARPPAEPAAARLRLMASDLGIVEGHLLLPADLAGRLPPIDRDYEDFGAEERGVQASLAAGGAVRPSQGEPPIAGTDVFAERLRDAERFVQSMRPQRARPPLYMGHFEVPHVPWRLLPSGHQYPVEGPSLPGLTDQTWTRNRYLVDQAMGRHMLQLGYADRLLGRLIQRLQDVGLWDRALVVVTADHGVGLRPGGSRRPVTTADFPGIAGVPLFVKLPQQRGASVDDGPARTIDILPTITSVVGAPGYVGDGVPLTTTRPTGAPSVRSGRRARLIGIGGLDAFVRARDAELARQRRIFPRGLASVFDAGPDRALLGRRLDALPFRSSTARAHIDGAAAFASVARRSGVLPVYVTGQLTRGARNAQALAVAVNGRVRAVGRSYASGGKQRFSMLIPPSSLRPGRNTITVVAVRGDQRVVRLARAGP
jgi:sulfatase-like protein